MISLLLDYLPNILLVLLLFITIVIAHTTSKHNFNAYDYLIDPATGKASITKTLQILAGLSSTWIVIRLAVNNNLTVEMFTVYLGALGVSEAWSKWVGAKYLKDSTPNN